MYIIQFKNYFILFLSEPFTSVEYSESMESIVSDFHDGYMERVDNLSGRHLREVNELQQLRKNFERLLVRSGYRKENVDESFEKKKAKDLLKIKKKNRLKRLNEIINKNEKNDFNKI